MFITRSELANLLSTAYWSAFAIALVILLLITFKVSRTAKGRTIGSLVSLLVVVGVFSIPFIPKSPKTQKAEEDTERQNATLSETGEAPFRPVAPTKSNYKIAKALFDEKCKTAGEKIYRTVNDVEGVALVRMPKPYKNAYAYDPMWERAALKLRTKPIYSLLETTFPEYTFGSFLIKPKKYYSPSDATYNKPTYGYPYVVVKTDDDLYLKYSLSFGSYKPVAIHVKNNTARYAVTYETIVNPEERKYWIANATIKVIDTKDNSLMAEKIIYAFDHGLGGGARGTSGRQPWTHAKKCPQDKIKNNEIRFFTEKVLKPKQPTITSTHGE